MRELRRAVVAGSWYPETAGALADAVERHLAVADHEAGGEGDARGDEGDARGGGVAAGGVVAGGDGVERGDGVARLVAIVAPHAGLMYSGPVAAHAYRLLRDRPFDLVVLVGPSHFVGFEGVSVYASGGFDTPFGVATIADECAAALLDASPIVRDLPAAHLREHSLEMQLPFVKHLAPEARIVPLVMGFQTAGTAQALGDALGAVLLGRPRTLLVASTDLSHYHDAATAARLDAVVIDSVSRFDPDALQHALDLHPGHACGGGPTVAVMRAARQLGARHAAVLRYADSGDVSGDKSAVVGYLAAAIGTGTP